MPQISAPVLIVDDDADQRLSLRAVLEPLVPEIAEAVSGEDALRQILRREFAVILLDVNMPGMSGFETAEYVRLRRSRETPIIFVSADDDDARTARGYSLGAVDYIARPINPLVLKAKVSVFLQLFRRREELAWHATTRQRLADAALAVHRSRSLEDVLAVVVDASCSVLQAGQAAIEVHARAIGSSEAAEQTEPVRRTLERPPGGPLAELARRSLARAPAKTIRMTSRELASQPFWTTPGAGAPPRGWLATPLRSGGGELLGWLQVADRLHGEFSADDEALLVQLAQLASIASESSLLAEAQRASRIGAALLQELDEERLLQRLTEDATQMTGASFGAFFFNAVNQSGESYMLYTLSGASREAFAGFPMPRATPLFAETFQGKGPLRLGDVRSDPRFGAWGPQPDGHLPVVSYLAVPVVAPKGTVLGGLFFSHTEPERFTAEHERLVLGIARQAAIALENARLYSELRKSEARTRRAYEAAALADRRKDRFLATLSHELRNPLAPIISIVQVLRMRGQRGLEIDVLERQAAHLVRLVDDLLDISRIQRGRLELQRERAELARVVTHALETVASLLEQKQHRLTTRVADGLLVDGDFTRLAQVVGNLVHNAAKFTPPGGEIGVDARREGSEIVLSVEDNGQGISAELLPTIFQEFTQGDQALDRSVGGLGLGLAIVRRLAEMHGGSVRCESAGADQGSRFVVRLPAARGDAAPAASNTAGSAAGSGPAACVASHRRILVVDDNLDAAEMLAVGLRQRGHEVSTAPDALRALDLAESFQPEVAVLDLGLPGMDGYELARRLRSDLPGPRLILALSGYGQEGDRHRSRAAGFDAHLVKPISPEALEEAIEHESAVL